MYPVSFPCRLLHGQFNLCTFIIKKVEFPFNVYVLGSKHAPAESLSLSVSGGSGQTIWPALVTNDHDKHGLSTTCGNQEDSDSDWDSWDDDQEVMYLE